MCRAQEPTAGGEEHYTRLRQGRFSLAPFSACARAARVCVIIEGERSSLFNVQGGRAASASDAGRPAFIYIYMRIRTPGTLSGRF